MLTMCGGDKFEGNAVTFFRQCYSAIGIESVWLRLSLPASACSLAEGEMQGEPLTLFCY